MGQQMRFDNKVTLSRRTSIALDCARSFAAAYVVIHHVVLTHNIGGPLKIFGHFGHQAVIAFFLLSGFVIYANERHRVNTDLRGYAVRRLRRIYPPLTGALIISVVVGALDGNLAENFDLWSLIGTLFAQQDTMSATPGSLFKPFMANSPLWSLAYEMWFYVLFPLAMAAYSRYREAGSIAVCAVCVLAYGLYIISPNHLLVMTGYFAVWWLGAMIAQAYADGFRNFLSVKIPMVGLACVVAVACIPLIYTRGPSQAFPFLQINHLASALIMAAILFSPFGKMLAVLSVPFVKPAVIVASFSYGLYVCHWPIMTQWSLSHTGPIGLSLCVLILISASVLIDPILAKAMTARRRESGTALSKENRPSSVNW